MSDTNQAQRADNVDAAEIARFDAAASRWWDPDGEFGALHRINPLRADYIADRVALDDAKLIDIGCGGGLLAEAMATRGARVTAIDMSRTAIEVAKLHLHESGHDIEYRESTAEAVADEAAGQFDVVTCLEMLEHVPSPASVVDAAARLVRPGGDVVFSTINRTAKAFALAIVGAEYGCPAARMSSRNSSSPVNSTAPRVAPAWSLSRWPGSSTTRCRTGSGSARVST